jgi:hypothetical protein
MIFQGRADLGRTVDLGPIGAGAVMDTMLPGLADGNRARPLDRVVRTHRLGMRLDPRIDGGVEFGAAHQLAVARAVRHQRDAQPFAQHRSSQSSEPDSAASCIKAHTAAEGIEGAVRFEPCLPGRAEDAAVADQKLDPIGRLVEIRQ